MSVTVLQPPILQGSAQNQLLQLRQYLFRLSQDLNLALSGVEAASAEKSEKSAKTGQKEEKPQLSALKSLIVKTADTVHAEMDRLETKLESSYVAQSTFGTFSEEIHSQIAKTAENVSQTVDYQAVLTDALNGVSNAFDQYVIETGGYIRQGIVGYENGVPVIGIAIGQDIRVTGTDTLDGETYEVINTASNMSVWTTNKLSFLVNGMEAAYVSNGAFYVADMYVTSRLFLNNWQISASRGLTIKWIGG